MDYFKLFLNFLNNILFSFNTVLKKYILEKTYCNAPELVSYEGIISFVLFIITLVISTIYEMKNTNCKYILYDGKCFFDNFYAYYEGINKKEIFIFILVFIYYSLYYFFFYATLKELSIFHIFLILIFEDKILYDIFLKYNEITKNDKWKLYVNIIIFFVLLFMLFVFTEIIEIYCFGMAKNSRRNILQRGACDYDEIEDQKFSLGSDYGIPADFDDNLVEYDKYDYSIELNAKFEE